MFIINLKKLNLGLIPSDLLSDIRLTASSMNPRLSSKLTMRELNDNHLVQYSSMNSSIGSSSLLMIFSRTIMQCDSTNLINEIMIDSRGDSGFFVS